MVFDCNFLLYAKVRRKECSCKYTTHFLMYSMARTKTLLQSTLDILTDLLHLSRENTPKKLLF